MAAPERATAEYRRLHGADQSDWRKWGPYLSDRAWGTVREDYSASGEAWGHLPHELARSKAYRWGEDGIAGFSDRYQSLCWSLALWNEHDPILAVFPVLAAPLDALRRRLNCFWIFCAKGQPRRQLCEGNSRY